MSDDKNTPKKNDLTGIFELPQTELPAATDENADPFAVNVMPENEHVDSFESIDQLGMVDHPEEPKSNEQIFSSDDFATTPSEPALESFETASEPVSDQITEPPVIEANFDSPSSDFFAASAAVPMANAMEEIKQYSEQTRHSLQDTPIHYPFHLLIQGQFGPFERDKLLLFITESPIGVSSQDLDLQIKGGRVLLPRISEYAGVRLIQELRDSGLNFSLKPSSRDEDERVEKAQALHYHFEAGSHTSQVFQIPVLSDASPMLAQYDEIDTVQNHQFIKAEMIEVERSDLFQEVIERMTESLKQKARLKGGHALYKLVHQVQPLRLPSQYQISVSAVVLRSRAVQ